MGSKVMEPMGIRYQGELAGQVGGEWRGQCGTAKGPAEVWLAPSLHFPICLHLHLWL